MPGVVTLAALCLAAAFWFERGAGGAWRLLRDGKPVDELPASGMAAAVRVPEDWREPVRSARRMPGQSTQKQLYIAFLKKRHGYQIAEVNAAYGLEASSFTDLESSDFAALDEARAGVAVDDIAFAAELYGDRLRAGPGVRVVVVPAGAPDELILALASLPAVDAIASARPGPVRGLAKPLLSLTCPAVKPAFIAACAGI